MRQTKPEKSKRLDHVLVERGFYSTRSRAQDAIRRGCVRVNGTAARKAGTLTGGNMEISISDPAGAYVSRAALKLIAGLDTASIIVEGKTCLDIGASTGGFTQILLERGAAKVYAIDVGHGQMANCLRNDPRVVCLEGLNARELVAECIDGVQPDIVMSDVSFISLRLALPPALSLAANGAKAVLLVKPQFEVGRKHVGKGGLIQDEALVDQCAEDLRDWLNAMPGWRATHLLSSPIDGGDGNREFLLCGEKA